MKMKYLLLACCLSLPLGFPVAQHAAAQTEPQNASDDLEEIVATGTRRRDPAMSAYLAGDYMTAEVEFERNAFCALRATRNFKSGVEEARDSSVQSDVNADAVSSINTVGGAGGAVTLPSAAPSASTPGLNTNDFKKNQTTNKRSCNDRGFQLYMAGLSQIKLGKLEDAKESFESAVFYRKSIYDAYFRLALLEYQDGNLKNAKKQYKRLKKLEANCRDCEFEKEIKEQVQYLENILI